MIRAVQRSSLIFTYVFTDVQRCSHMFKDGQWPLVTDVHRWSLMFTIVHRCSQMFTDGQRWSHMFTDVQRCPQTFTHGHWCSWCHYINVQVGWCPQMFTDLQRWSLSSPQCAGGHLHLAPALPLLGRPARGRGGTHPTSITRWGLPHRNIEEWKLKFDIVV